MSVPFDCVEIERPADARPYSLMGAATTAGHEAWMEAKRQADDPACTDLCTGVGACAGSCTTAAGAVVDFSVDTLGGSEWRWGTVSVTPPPGTSWSRLDVAVDGGDSASKSWEVSWSGVLFAEWPEDGAFRAYRFWSSSGTGSMYSEYWDDGTCAWRADKVDGDVTVELGGHEVDVYDGYVDPFCGGAYILGPPTAWVDGVLWGVVDPATWEAVGTDADGDGWPSTWDCDDADANANFCAAEVLDDGVDQDCDGADDTVPPPRDTAEERAEEPEEDEAPEGEAARSGCHRGATVFVLLPFAVAGRRRWYGWTRSTCDPRGAGTSKAD